MKSIFQSLFIPLCFAAVAYGQTKEPEIFLEGIPSGFTMVDMDHDDDGNTYILGSRAGSAVVVKYDSSGLTSANSNITISGFIPVAFDVIGDEEDGEIYIASTNGLVKYGTDGVRDFGYGVTSGIRDVVYAAATDKLYIGIQLPGYPPLVQVYQNGGRNFQQWLVPGELGWQGSPTIRSMTVDDQGSLYVVGETGSNPKSAAGDPWSTYAPGYGGPVPTANQPYLIQVESDLSDYTYLGAHSSFDSVFDVSFGNGWVYAMGKDDGKNAIRVTRYDTTLEADRSFRVENPDYGTLVPATAGKMNKFSLASDALDNVYITGYTGNGTTKFFSHNVTPEFRSIAGTVESAFVAKLNSDFEFQWVKAPVQDPFPEFGANSVVAWDGRNSRLWWSGSFRGAGGITMQEGSDSSTAKTLPIEAGNWQGFAAAFQPSGEFTQVVDFSISTKYAANRVLLNGEVLVNPGAALPLILNSSLTIRSPRTVYRWESSPDLDNIETDDLEGKEVTINNAETRYSFINFSVNSVVQDSDATVYTFELKEQTTVQLEWLVEHALIVDSYLDDTASLATIPPAGTPFVNKLSSKAAGDPSPSVGKHWIEEDSPVVMEINGAVEDLAAHPGLAVRYVPWRYRVSGAAEAAAGGLSDTFGNVEPRQQIDEFSMTGPATVTYDWKLQYGVDVSATNLAANPDLLVEFVSAPATPTTSQSTSQGSGVSWWDDGTTVRIGSPRTISVGAGLLDLTGWINGDGFIFDPAEGQFDPTQSNPFTSDQVNAGYSIYTSGGIEYLGREVVLERPGKAIWNYGAAIIVKEVTVGNYIEFTPAEVANFELKVGDQPQLSAEPTDPTAGTDSPSSNDFIWDDVAKRFYPLRPSEMNLLWSSTNGNLVRVELTTEWGEVDYRHIANAAPVSLIPHPPESEPDELVFQEVAYTSAEATVDDDKQFIASQAGLTVLEFSRATPAGRGGISQNVVELKVVQTKLWNTGLGPAKSATVGSKITSSSDLAKLGTGYVFFPKARYNPFVYNRDLFTGEALWNESEPPGPVIPVNIHPTASAEGEDELVVVWYDDPVVNDYMLWPYIAERYLPDWPTDSGRILMSSGFGSESVGADGQDQEIIGEITVDGEPVPAATTFDPARFEQVQVYSQADRNFPGFNPNEEHALIAPSLRFADVAPRPMAVYAMRENDLNQDIRNNSYTSDPYVLVQFLDKAENEFKMKVFEVVREDLVNYPDGFSTEMKAGEPVIPFYPLGVVGGATICASNYAREDDPTRLTYWKDHKKSAWAVSGDGQFTSFFYYPLTPDFWWPGDAKSIGDCVAWLPDTAAARDRESFDIDYSIPTETPDAQGVSYSTVWPLTVPTLKVGETLTFPGGEYAADNPGNPGLPGVLAWSAGEVVFDNLNPDMREGAVNPDGKTFENYTARMISALEERTVDLPVAQFPPSLLPATGRTEVDGAIYRFAELSSSLKKRIFYNPLSGKLGIKGFVNDKDIADDTLTASPPAVYVLEPNIFTQAEYEELLGTGEGSPFSDVSADDNWKSAVNALFKLSRNPNQLSGSRILEGGEYTAGLQVQSTFDPATGTTSEVATAAESYQARGPGLALVANPGFLDPNDDTLPDVSYVTLAENNDPDLGGSPVILHVIKVDRRERYRGAIKVVLSDNVFDENIVLRHTGDFGANADDLTFDWWYRVEDGTEAAPPDAIPAGQTNPWKFFPDPSDKMGDGFFQLKLKGNPQAPELLLADSLWFVRYRHKDEEPDDPLSWEATPPIPYDWAGAGNSRPGDYQAQLAQGWVKRVLDAVNPYEARIRDFTGDSPATYSSMIRQFGARYEGAVALNPDKNVIENVGLIELYSTILNRAKDLSINLSTPVSTPGITNALLLASTRLADFYMLLGNEAYTDAKDPAIGFGSDSVEYGSLAPTVFTFQNQLASKMDEELGLLRGVDDFKARPVYNRLFWNFTKGEGEAAYATSYNISDVTGDGFIDEDDAMVLFPQGHGDAWGHYLTAIGGQYDLLNNPFFNWVSRSELYSLQDIVFEVDFLDERKFAQVAAAKAKAGADIVDLTYRKSYVEDPESQWQGYLDTDPERAWGVEGWARRAGQGAYFDWVTANALIPSEHPNSSFTGIRKVDRTTVKDIAVVSANMNAVQQTFDDANNGYNPLGIAGNTVPFDIDPTFLEVGSGIQGVTHFEQVYERAVNALNNAVAVFDNANELRNMLRRIENNEIEFRRSVFEQDLAYRNQLISIFGSPYSGTIGSGAAYPPGYDGPDTSLYMYVDKQVREITAATVPSMTTAFSADINDIDDSYSDFTDTDFRSGYAPSFSSNSPSDWFANFEGVDYIVTGENGIDFDSGNARVGLGNIQLPIKASGYTFEAPSSWGQRSSPGQLQLHIAAMIQQEAELAKAIAAWDGFQGGVVRQLRLVAAQQDADEVITGLMIGKIANNTVLGAANIALDRTADGFDLVVDGLDATNSIVRDAVISQLPTAGFSFSPGDALAPLRAALGSGFEGTKFGFKTAGLTVKTVSSVSDLAKGLIDMGLDLGIDFEERDLALKQALVELENMVGDEGILRVEIFNQQEALRAMSEEYRAMLQEGARLLDEREAYNKRVAELVQRNRYQDMSFRVSRNAALQRYQEAYDLAARYIYLAAKAYDYETNLHPSDAGSAQSVLTNIVRQRGLGMVVDGVPQIGKGGLAEQLATLKANFDTLEGQLGLNNPQTETGRFSLREELYRIAPDASSDSDWSDQLAMQKVDNLWDMPEFRRYCRPFAAYDPASPEPGLVVEFSSEIMAGKNFFGKALAGGDNAYDPTNFSTKIFSVGVWFEDYLSDGFSTGLSETPRVYLVPVGTDIMTFPSDNDLGARLWNVLDQKIPVPYPVLDTNLDDNAWRPLDTLGGTEGEIRKFSSFRAYPDSGAFQQDEMTFDTRLVGRSVWNTRWLLIIPGSTLKADQDEGLQTFINNVTDIKLFFQTYGFSGN